MAELPRVDPGQRSLAVGDRVWAVVPSAVGDKDLAELGSFRIEAIEGDRVRLADPVMGVVGSFPAGLVFAVRPAIDAAELEPGTVVLTEHRGERAVPARVESGGRLAIDWNGQIVNLDGAPWRTGDGALRWVWLRRALAKAERLERVQRALLFAETGDRLWVLDETRRRVEVLPLDAGAGIEPMAWSTSPSAGERGRLYREGVGLEAVEVVEVLEPDLRFLVRTSGGEEVDATFEQLAF